MLSEDLLKIIYAVIAGGLIGFEREYRDKSAGLRTIMFICVGSTVFTILSMHFGAGDPSRVAAGLVTGIGFIGTGVIRREKGQTSGITTAALIWVTAGIGMAIGQGSYNIALLTLITSLILMWFLPFIEFKFAPQKEQVQYSLTISNDIELLQSIKEEIAKHKVKIINETIQKEDDDIVVNLNILGFGKSHKEINRFFIDNSKIKRCILS